MKSFFQTRWMLSFLVLGFAVGVYAAAEIDETTVEKIIVVDPSGNGDVKTIGEAFDQLNAEPERAMKVLIREGVYREPVTSIKPRSASATVIEGEGKVVISGADRWTEWTAEEDSLVADWPYDWGKAKYDGNYIIKNDLGLRSEIVWVDGNRMTQVATKDELELGSFWVDEEGDQLWLKLPEGQTEEKAVIEVSVRHQLFWAREVSNLVLRNLTFAHAANGPQHGSGRFAVAIFGNAEKLPMRDLANVSRNLLIEGCTFTGNNASGMTLSNYEKVRIDASHFDGNGISGSGISRLRFAEISNCSFNENNWRIGGYGRFYDWAPAGIKLFECADLLMRDSESHRNLTMGFWYDWKHERITLRNLKANDNYGAGLYLEGSVGPFLVQDSEFKRNAGKTYHGANHGGVLIAESRNVTLAGCVLEDNNHGQLMIRTRPREGCGGYQSGKQFAGSVMNVTLLNNRLVGKRATPAKGQMVEWFSGDRLNGGLIVMSTHSSLPMYRNEFLPTLWADGNRYFHTDTENVFSEGGDYGFKMIPLPEWKERTKQDANSGWGLEE